MTETMEQVMRKELGDLTGRLLKYSDPNAKLKGIMSFSLPAGHACPGADKCLAKTVKAQSHTFLREVLNKVVRKFTSLFYVQDGPNAEFRCFAATDEAKYGATRNQRWHNKILLTDAGTTPAILGLIEKSFPKTFAPFRLHVAGDFFTQAYFDAWLEFAIQNPNQIFYAYTKSLPLWIARLDKIPANFRLTASYGGKWDHLISQYNLRSAKVVFSEEQAQKLGLEIDHDDSHAYGNGPSFALLLHGTQPAGSEAAKAWSALKHIGKGGYHRQAEGRLGLGAALAAKKKRNSAGINSPVPVGA